LQRLKYASERQYQQAQTSEEIVERQVKNGRTSVRYNFSGALD